MKNSHDARILSAEVSLPASTSNLGAGFDCFGLAVQLYLKIRATVASRSAPAFRVRISGGQDNISLPRTAENLICRSMAYVASREGLRLPPLRLSVHNEIPLGRGLGSSAAAIVGGIKLVGVLCEREIPQEKVFQYATEFEGHADNVAATLLGGFIVTCVTPQHIIALKRSWPNAVKVIIACPNIHVETRLARAALSRLVTHVDAVFNLQRAALFNAALSEGRYDLLWEAMRDRLHQEKRQTLVPGLAQALALPPMPGLLGLSLSGAGPSVVALAQDNFSAISNAIASCFRKWRVTTTVLQLEIDTEGCQTRVLPTA
jgi:homoserine kinase